MKQLRLPFPAAKGAGFPKGRKRPTEAHACATCGREGRWLRPNCSVCHKDLNAGPKGRCSSCHRPGDFIGGLCRGCLPAVGR